MYTNLVIIYYIPAGLVPGVSPPCILKSVHFYWKTKRNKYFNRNKYFMAKRG